MSATTELTFDMSKLSLSPKISALESLLHQSITNLKDVSFECEQLCLQSETYKTELETQREKCESNNCSSSEALKKVIAAKDEIIQCVASALTKLEETKNFIILKHIFKILCGEAPSLLPYKIEEEIKENLLNNTTPSTSIKKELSVSLEDVSIKEESVTEIEGTPGRISPIIPSKIKKSMSSMNSETREKKKCPDDCDSRGTPEPKAMRLHFPGSASKKSGSGRYIQSRILFDRIKPTNVVDLTISPDCSPSIDNLKQEVQMIIKKESSENDDTILPSPTSGSAIFLRPRNSKDKSEKLKKPGLSLKHKSEDITNSDKEYEEIKTEVDMTAVDMEESINILKPNRYTSNKKQSPKKVKQEVDEDMTVYEPETVDIKDVENFNNSQILGQRTPIKRPLCENINVANLPTQCDTESSISLLRHDYIGLPNEEKVARKTPEKLEPVYKEPTVRKKAEKLTLPAWVCEECRTFYSELYKEDPEMISKVIARCGKHRGRNNPIRPKTPPGFWNPRWNLPEDTEEFNKMNNAG